MEEKTVCIDIEEIGAAAPISSIEVSYFPSSVESDVEQVKAMIGKEKPWLSCATFKFQRRGKKFKDRWVDLEDDAVLMDMGEYKCLIVGKNNQVNSNLKPKDQQISEPQPITEVPPRSADHALSEAENDAEGEQSEPSSLSDSPPNAMDQDQSSAVTSPAEKRKAPHGTSSALTPQAKRRFNRKTFNLPTRLSVNLEKKIKSKEPFFPEDYSELCRVVRPFIELETEDPSRTDLEFVAQKLVEKYPSIVPSDQSVDAIVNMLRKKWVGQFGRQRQKTGTQKSTKGGRPRKDNNLIDRNPGARTDYVPVNDPVSYESNVKKMFDLHQRAGDSHALNYLWRATFEGRRAEVRMGKILTSGVMLNDKCPLLNRFTYICGELDMIYGEGKCDRFRAIWRDLVPQIIRVAKSKRGKQFKSVLSLYGDLSKSEESRNRAALELLPLLIPGKKKGEKAQKYFCHLKEDSADFVTTLHEIIRPCPYIIGIGNSFHVIVDGKAMVFLQDKIADAFLCLVASYYVFGVKWCPDILPTYLFIQKQLLEDPDDVTDTNNEVAIFLNLVTPAVPQSK